MRRFSTLLLSGVFLVAPATSVAKGPPVLRPSCVPAHARVLKSNREAAVYRIRKLYKGPLNTEFLEPVIETRGCAVGSRHSYFVWLEPPEPTEAFSGVDNLVLRGTMLAYEWSYNEQNRFANPGEGSAEWRVIVRNLRVGRVVHDVLTGASHPAHPKYIGDGRTFAIVVKADGAVAWTTGAESGDYGVHLLDRRGGRELTVGPTLDPNSLALAGNTIHWTQGGKRMSAPLH